MRPSVSTRGPNVPTQLPWPGFVSLGGRLAPVTPTQNVAQQTLPLARLY